MCAVFSGSAFFSADVIRLASAAKLQLHPKFTRARDREYRRIVLWSLNAVFYSLRETH